MIIVVVALVCDQLCGYKLFFAGLLPVSCSYLLLLMSSSTQESAKQRHTHTLCTRTTIVIYVLSKVCSRLTSSVLLGIWGFEHDCEPRMESALRKAWSATGSRGGGKGGILCWIVVVSSCRRVVSCRVMSCRVVSCRVVSCCCVVVLSNNN
jgi:hypothetical protein